MQLTEIKEKVSKTAIPAMVYTELMQYDINEAEEEVDSVHMLADEMQRAVQKGNVWKVPFSESTKRYLLHISLPKKINVALENANKPLALSLQRLQARLHAKLS